MSHLLKSLGTLAGPFDAKNLSGLLQASQDPQKNGTSAGTSSEVPTDSIANGVSTQTSPKEIPTAQNTTCGPSIHCPCGQINHSACVAAAQADDSLKNHINEASLGQYVLAVLCFTLPHSKQKPVFNVSPFVLIISMLSADSTVGRTRLKGFDLNSVYIDMDDCMEMNVNSASLADRGEGSPVSPSCLLQGSQQSSPPPMSVNSDSTSSQLQSSSSGDVQVYSRSVSIINRSFFWVQMLQVLNNP